MYSERSYNLVARETSAQCVDRVWIIASCKLAAPILVFSIHQISGQQFSRVLIGSGNLEYPWIFTVLGRNSTWLLVSRQFQKMKF